MVDLLQAHLRQFENDFLAFSTERCLDPAKCSATKNEDSVGFSRRENFLPVDNLAKLSKMGQAQPQGQAVLLGMKKKFTVVREALVQIFEEENGKEAFRKISKHKNGKINLAALDRIIAVMLKAKDFDENPGGQVPVMPIIVIDGKKMHYNIGKPKEEKSFL